MKLKLTIAVSLIALFVLLASSQINNEPFAPAKDFPREALIYVQIADLPAAVKLWNESQLKEKYTASDNYYTFANQHLGRKLASRWREFNAAATFSIDLETVAKLANNQAALAIYDIGKLEFVFIAPVSDELFAASQFWLNRDKFASETLPDGTVIYRANVNADRGRQKQELIFTNVKNRFVLATGEKLLMQTLNNINGAANKNRLIDEPSMTILSEKTAVHSATVWLNQTALNDDYYFKRYWLMSDVKDLKNIRAGVFDFEMQNGKYVEHRRFLLENNSVTPPIAAVDAERLLSFAPDDIPFYRLRKATAKTVDETIRQTVSESRKTAEKSAWNNVYYSRYDNYADDDYEDLSEDYDAMIDDVDDETTVKSAVDIDLSKVLTAANPSAVLTFTEPKILPAPLFVEFRRAAIYHLNTPDAFDQTAFETAIEGEISGKILISSPGVKLNWETKTENDVSRRELNAPMLGWSVGYVLRGNELILTNNAKFLIEIVAAERIAKQEFNESSLTGLTVINLDRKADSYDRVFDELAKNNSAQTFFTDNVGSLLDTISDVKRVEIRQNFSGKIYEEEISFALKQMN